ncbi:MAG: ClpXP protease specificity-enhancing factor SspB [Magnetospirillum sp. WYHS-4]
MTDSGIHYDQWIEEALRGVVRRALSVAVLEGLPGKHHFYVTFDTTAPGVSIAPHLKARYPEEMTIVLQHQFENLEVDDEALTVVLYFGGKAERLYIPLAAMTGFADPSVNFGLQLRMSAPADDKDDKTPPASEDRPVPVDAEAEDGNNVVTLDAFRGGKKK